MPDPHAPGSTSLSAAGRALIHALCEATRTETVQEGAFAEPSAHAAYVRRNLCSRASSLASMLLLDVLVRGKHAEDVPQEELRAVACARSSLLLSRQKLTVLALGGGPGFEAAAIAALADFMGSPVDLDVCIADVESAWLTSAAAIHRAIVAGRASSASLRFRFVHADVTVGLEDARNAALDAVIDGGVDLVVCAYVLVETAHRSRANNWSFLSDCANRLASHPSGCYVIALDSTHRVWPEVVEALRRGAPSMRSWLPRHPITRKVSLLALLGGSGAAEMDLSNIVSTPPEAESAAAAAVASKAQFHASADFEWRELSETAAPLVEALHRQRTNGEANGVSEEQEVDEEEEEGEEDAPAELIAGSTGASGGTATTASSQIEGWERHFLRHVDAPSPFFRERRSLLEQFPILAEGDAAAPLRVLEVGCGNGASALALLRGNAHALVHATDPSAAAVAQARRAVAATGLAARLSTAVQPTPTTPAAGLSAPADVAMILFTLSAVPGDGDGALLAAAAAALRPGGAVLVRDYGLYDTRHLRDARRATLLSSVTGRPHEYLRPGGMHRRYYSLESMAELAAGCGLHVAECRYLCVRLHNAKRALTMSRVYVHAVLRKDE